MSAPSPPTSPLGTRAIADGDALRIVLATVLFGVAGYMGVAYLFAGSVEADDRRNYAIAFHAMVSLAMLGAIYLVLIRGRNWQWADLGYVVCARPWMVRALAAGALAVPVMTSVYAAMIRDGPVPDGFQRAVDFHLGGDLPVIQGAVYLLYVGFLVPIVEELLFRGVIHGWLRRRLAPGAAIAVSSAIFGAAHMRLDLGIVAFLLGAMLALLFERSRSLVAPILMHQTYNTGVTVLSYVAALTPAAALPTGAF